VKVNISTNINKTNNYLYTVMVNISLSVYVLVFLCFMIWGETKLLDLLILVEFLFTITV
jgi:hypothetical protein